MCFSKEYENEKLILNIESNKCIVFLKFKLRFEKNERIRKIKNYRIFIKIKKSKLSLFRNYLFHYL